MHRFFVFTHTFILFRAPPRSRIPGILGAGPLHGHAGDRKRVPQAGARLPREEQERGTFLVSRHADACTAVQKLSSRWNGCAPAPHAGWTSGGEVNDLPSRPTCQACRPFGAPPRRRVPLGSSQYARGRRTPGSRRWRRRGEESLRRRSVEENTLVCVPNFVDLRKIADPTRSKPNQMAQHALWRGRFEEWSRRTTAWRGKMTRSRCCMQPLPASGTRARTTTRQRRPHGLLAQVLALFYVPPCRAHLSLCCARREPRHSLTWQPCQSSARLARA